jgi:hypothetical protein
MTIIPALGSLRQEHQEFEGSLGYSGILWEGGRKGGENGGRKGGRKEGREVGRKVGQG